MKWMLTVAYLLFTLALCLPTYNAVATTLIKASNKPTVAEKLKPHKPLLIHGNIASVAYLDPGNVVPEHLVEFGFYHSGWTIDEIPEVAKFSTFVDVYNSDVHIMEAARRHGLKLWVQVAPIFFDGSNKLKRMDDYYERWQRAKKKLEPYEDIILAFDPLDEPFYRSSMSDLDLKLFLEEISELIKQDFPSVKGAITFTNKTVNKSNFKKIIPKNYDLFGVDYYVGINFQYKIVKELMNKTSHIDVKYYLIPRAFKTSNIGFGTIEEEKLIDRARQAYNFAIANPKVVAIFPFVWESFIGKGDYYLGADHLERVRKEYQKIGVAISNSR
ncbi:hypothetical protein [Microbulbifer sp. JTAC008]|uniref:hypothetical protein n=1 Tax=unclassified Microbulbifer TaxID=2619833 RepID=UPI0040392F1C